METGKPKESLVLQLWDRFSSLVQRGIGRREKETRTRVNDVLQNTSEPAIERPTMLSLVTSVEKGKLDDALDVAAALERLEQGEPKVEDTFTLGDIPFNVSFSFPKRNNALVYIRITSPADTDVEIECNFMIDEKLMDLMSVFMGGLKENKLGATIMRSLLRGTERVEISSIVNRDTQKVGWSASSGDLPDYTLKNTSPLAGMLGKEFICKFQNHGNEIIGIRVDKTLQALLRAAKNYDGDTNELRNIYGAYVQYMTSPAYRELDAEAQNMCVVQRDALAEMLSK